MAITATYTPAEAHVGEDTVAIAFSGLANSTTYLVLVNPTAPTSGTAGTVASPGPPLSGDAAANVTTWNGLIANTGGGQVFSSVFTTGGSQTTKTINFVPQTPGLYSVGIYVIAFSNSMTGGATFTAISAG